MLNENELKILSEQGNAEAQFLLGSMYMDENNAESGIYWIRKSAEQGYGHAQDCICMCYSYGIGVTENDFQANYWGKKAYENEERGTYIPNMHKLPKCVQNRLIELQKRGEL
jgi:TPR repeat protein